MSHVTDLPIPASPDDLTPGWLTIALRPHTGPASTVVEATAQRIGEDTGLIADIYRVSLTWDNTTTATPATVVAKLLARDRQARSVAASIGTHDREVRFYQELASSSPVRTLACFLCLHDRNDNGFVLLLEDRSGDELVDLVGGCSEQQVTIVLDRLARLHASWWNKPELDRYVWLPRQIDAIVRQAESYDECWPLFSERFLPSDSFDTALAGLAKRVARHLDLFERAPPTLLHGDAKCDNIFFGLDGDVTFFDWANPMRGPAMCDVTYFLSSSVDASRRRRIESDQLKRYHGGLLVLGVEGYPFDDCLLDYRAQLLVLWLRRVVAATKLAYDLDRSLEKQRAWSRRLLTALSDANALDLVP